MRVHANAPWTPLRRRQLIGAVAAGDLSVAGAAELGGVSVRTVYRWLARWRAGDRRLEDRPSVAGSHPNATDPDLVDLIVRLRRQRWTTPQLAFHLGLPLSTVTAICRRHGLGRLGPATPPEPPNRYQRRRPGELIHLDIKKLGRIGRVGHRIHGDRTARDRGAGWEHAHVAIDDATRLAYAEVLDQGETAEATAAFLTRAVAWFATRGIVVERVMTDNGPGYQSYAFADSVAAAGLRHLRTRPYRPRTNGKAERFIRILLGEWAYRAPFTSSAARTSALPAFLHYYNHHRPHGSLDRATPGQRLHALNNGPGNYT